MRNTSMWKEGVEEIYDGGKKGHMEGNREHWVGRERWVGRGHEGGNEKEGLQGVKKENEKNKSKYVKLT